MCYRKQTELNELTGLTLTMKTNQLNQMCERRLLQHITKLDKRREKVVARVTFDMEQLKKSLENVSIKSENLSNEISAERHPKARNSVGFYPRSEYCSAGRKSFSAYESGTSDSCLDLSQPQRGPNKRREIVRRELASRRCDHGLYGRCPHFPCRLPQTYHSLGFRPDNCSTNRWIPWSELQKETSENVLLGLKSRIRHVGHKFRALVRNKITKQTEMKQQERKTSRLHWEINYGKQRAYKNG
ncbi:uncharacterized protein LOC131942990 [Physella acuta]|uniref:uncharacterized protein LOC131942990 n=1 Tax=Physella acuta TaxID=109671 RepID=UPI0027DCC06F|nr:uncharacterized protein LOC131942990 [Physella acuta]